MRELFAVDVRVKEMLPEDAIAQGFDNVGAALNLSPVLMERYLEAADAVLTAALLPVHKIASKQERFDLYDSLPKWFANGVYKQADGVVLFRGGATDLRQFKAPAPGRYRFRIAVSAHNSAVPLPLGLLVGNFVVSGNYARHLGYFDAPPGKPAVIEFEERLGAKNDTVKIMPMALPFVYLKQETMAEYPGPGLKVHWMEVEGPFPEAWPTESYRRVLGDVDRSSARWRMRRNCCACCCRARSVGRWWRARRSRLSRSSRSRWRWGSRLRRRCARATRRCWRRRSSYTFASRWGRWTTTRWRRVCRIFCGAPCRTDADGAGGEG